MKHSQFEDRYDGRRFVVTFYKHENGFTADLAIEGLPLIQDDDNCWKDREDAMVAMTNLAHNMIRTSR